MYKPGFYICETKPPTLTCDPLSLLLPHHLQKTICLFTEIPLWYSEKKRVSLQISTAQLRAQFIYLGIHLLTLFVCLFHL